MAGGLYSIQGIEYCGYFSFTKAPKVYHNYHTGGESIYPIVAKYRVYCDSGMFIAVEIPKKSKKGYVLYDLEGHYLCSTQYSLGSHCLYIKDGAFVKAVNATLKYDIKSAKETEEWFQARARA